jgi:diadenosine tetraphosphate (Ap4A) HIT family hydrolase
MKIFIKNFDENFNQELDSQLKRDSFFIANLELSTLLLNNDANYPWLILVPRIEFAYDLTDLEILNQNILINEINICANFLKENFVVDKLNIASLGNVVRQLHVHIIARQKIDLTFPKPVWGNAQIKPYQINQAQELIKNIQQFLIKNAKS